MLTRDRDWLTGGAWGPEGGLAAAVGMMAALTYLYRATRRVARSHSMTDRIAVHRRRPDGQRHRARVRAGRATPVTMIDVSGRGARARDARRSRRTSTGRSRRARSTRPSKDATSARITDRRRRSTPWPARRSSIEAATENRGAQVQDLRRTRRLAPRRRDPRHEHQLDLDHRDRRRAPSGPTQVIGMHFMNPVPVMQLVEVIRGLATSDETTRRVVDARARRSARRRWR